jgi:hypothetical protein
LVSILLGGKSDENFDFFADVLPDVDGFDWFEVIGARQEAKRCRFELPCDASITTVNDSGSSGGGGGGGGGGAAKQGNPNPGLARTSDRQRLLELRGECDIDIGLKCHTAAKPGRLYKSTCQNSGKCRQLVLSWAFDHDVEEMKKAAAIARRKYEGPARKVSARAVLSVGNCENPKERDMQSVGVDVCLSHWVWWFGYGKGMIKDVMQEIKLSRVAKGDLRLGPKPKEWTIKASTIKWMKPIVNGLCQDSPEHLEGDRDIAPRKFLGGIKVRGALYEHFLLDLADDGAGTMKFCVVGYFKTIFDSQYGRLTGPLTGNFWATDRKSSLMGGYCLPCSDGTLKMTSTDLVTQAEGKLEHAHHVGLVKRIRELLDYHVEKAKKSEALVEGDDAASSGGTACPIMQKIAQKFVIERIHFKVVECVLFHTNGHPNFCRRVVSAPWVQGTSNFQVHCQLFCSLPAMAEYYLRKQEPCPDTYIRWSDGGGDTWNITLLAVGFFLAQDGVFTDVYLNR